MMNVEIYTDFPGPEEIETTSLDPESVDTDIIQPGCASEAALNHMGYGGECPWKTDCGGDHDGGTCKLAGSLQRQDSSKRGTVRAFSQDLEQSPEQES